MGAADSGQSPRDKRQATEAKRERRRRLMFWTVLGIFAIASIGPIILLAINGLGA